MQSIKFRGHMIKKILLLATILISHASFAAQSNVSKIILDNFGKNHPTIQIGEVTIDNVLIRSTSLLTSAIKCALESSTIFPDEQIKDGTIGTPLCGISAPILTIAAIAELVTGPFHDIVQHGFNGEMPETTIMNALDLW